MGKDVVYGKSTANNPSELLYIGFLWVKGNNLWERTWFMGKVSIYGKSATLRRIIILTNYVLLVVW